MSKRTASHPTEVKRFLVYFAAVVVLAAVLEFLFALWDRSAGAVYVAVIVGPVSNALLLRLPFAKQPHRA
jgi:hypothetical protein